MSTQSIAPSNPRRLSPVAALLWEEWRQTRLALLAGSAPAVLGLLGILALFRWRSEVLDKEVVSTLASVLMIQLFCWQAAVLLFSGYGRNDMTMQFPRRLFALPVSSVLLALTRLAYGIAVVALTFGVLGWLLAKTDRMFQPGSSYAFLAVQSLIYVESIAWCLGRRPLLALGVGVVFWLPLAWTFQFLSGGLKVPPFSSLLAAFVPGSAVFMALALYAVRMQRYGGGSRVANRVRFGRAEADAPKLAQTPVRALFGLEWRRRGRWILGFGLLSFFLMGLMSRMVMSPAGLLFGLFLGCVSGLFAAGMFQTIVSEREKISGLQRFISTRPVSTRELARARLLALGLGCSVTFVVLSFLMLLMLQLGSMPGRPRALALQTLFSPVRFIEQRVETLHKRDAFPQQSGRHAQEAALPARAALDARAVPETDARALTGATLTGRPSALQGVQTVDRYDSSVSLPIRVLAAVVFFWLLGWLCLTQPLITLFLFYLIALVANSIDWKSGPVAAPGPYTALCAVMAAGFLGATVLYLYRAFRLRLLSRRALYTVLAAWFALAYSAVLLCVRAGGTPWEVLGLQSPVVGVAVVLAGFALPFWPLARVPLSIHRRRHQ